MSRKLPRAGMPALFTSRPIAGCRSSTRAATVVDLRAVGDVADLPLAADLRGDALELVRAPREQDAVPAPARELARDRLADARRGSRDHRDSLPGHRRATLSD